MAKRQTVRASSATSPSEEAPAAASAEVDTTGSFLVLFRKGAANAGVKLLEKSAGVRMLGTREAGAEAEALAASEGVGTGLVFDELDVAVVNAVPDQMRALRAESGRDSALLAVEPERYSYALWRPEPGGGGRNTGQVFGLPPADYLRGYRDAVVHLADRLLQGATASTTSIPFAESLAQFQDSAEATWGLEATQVLQSGYSGRGIRVAILDSGLDLNHPDFLGRPIVSESFVPAEATVQDTFGHGTHTTGTACGPQRPAVMPRYAVAYGADLYVAKVLRKADGKGPDRSVLAGINWAIKNKCSVISMSLGSAVKKGESFSPVYEGIASNALKNGVLIIAAAGNDSHRSRGDTQPVGRPANCPSIMAVAALDSQLRVAEFSNAGINPDGGQVDIAAPGVDVRSSFPMPTEYKNEQGTSMATPHVSGIAALHAEADRSARGQALWARLVQMAKRLEASSADVGAGLVQAP